MKRYLVGLTGGLASGKSTVAKWFGKAGFHVVDADRVVAELYAPGGAGAAALGDLLGPHVLDEAGAVDRPKVAELIFGDSALRQQVERAIHPLVHQHFRTMASAMSGVIVYEATLLVESGHSRNFDMVISVEADTVRRLEWAVQRGMSQEDAAARLKAQGDGAQRRAGADLIIRNDDTLEDLRHQVDQLIEKLKAKVEEVG